MVHHQLTVGLRGENYRWGGRERIHKALGHAKSTLVGIKNSPLHMIWAGRRDHMEGYITPIAGMPSSSVGYLRELLVWYSIQRPDESVMIQIRGEREKNNMSTQGTLREDLKVWRLVQL